MSVTVIWIVIGALWTISKVLKSWLEELEIIGRADTIQIRVMLRFAWTLKSVLKTWNDFLSLRLQLKTIS